MRGTPWIRFAITSCILALVGIPIWLLVWSEAPSETTARAAAPARVDRDLTIEVESAPAAESIGVNYLGQELVSTTGPAGSYSGTIRLPATGADLVVAAKWSGTQTVALRVRVSDHDGPIAEASYWGTDSVEDVLTIPESAE